MGRTDQPLTRRRFLAQATGTAAAAAALPLVVVGSTRPAKLVTCPLGNTGFLVTTMGLGGQASLQWTPEDVDPATIIVKAYRLGINYFDTSNVYGASQTNCGTAFRQLGLVPGRPEYEQRRRRQVFVASKTMLRSGKGRVRSLWQGTEGPKGSTAVDDLKRSLSQIFGDGQGNYPDDAYLDLFQIHNLTIQEDVDAIYEGLEKPDPQARRIGVLAALRDYRDGTNLTGLNPNEERRIRHIGITGHQSSPVLMDCIQRDQFRLLDTLLVAVNANDRRYFSHQNNVIPVAEAKGMGIIAMKVFADGVLYGREPRWNGSPGLVVRQVGSRGLPSRRLIQYSLSTPGVALSIVGIGHIDNDPTRCQLVDNLAASQRVGPLDERARRDIEELAAAVRAGATNYFQRAAEPLSPPRLPTVEQQLINRERVVRLTWHTAYAADEPLCHYVVRRDSRAVSQVAHRPQTTTGPFQFVERLADRDAHRYTISAVDAANRTAESAELLVETVG
jgi:aryl-alcohol dehydrogenase-like predicted oxidoreductase